ncbi:hypothetical protein EXS57_02330 [Candidatus Kaiserbacteria bacterium]|nr:hypothetical protein [Candidatus Kaiserbacteria bacterium]
MTNQQTTEGLQVIPLPFAIAFLALFALVGLGVLGYFVNPNTSNNTSVTGQLSPIFYTVSVTNIRACASLTCHVIGQYPAGAYVSADAADFASLPEWVSVTQDASGNSVAGYVNKIALSPEPPSYGVAPTATSNSPEIAGNPAVSSVPASANGVSNVDELRACAQQANANFNSIIASETKNAADLRALRTYTNHFNAKEKRCFMVITSISNDIGSKMQRLYDVYDNKKLASNWKVKNSNDLADQSPGLCLIYNASDKAYGDCNIVLIFEEKMESATY